MARSPRLSRIPRWSSPRVGYTAVLVAFALACAAVAIVAARQIAAETAVREALRASYENIVLIQRTFSTIQDAEIGQRGYVITGNEVFLVPYHRAVAVLDRQEQELAAAIGDRPVGAAGSDRLHDVIARKRRHMQDTIDAYDGQGPEAAAAMVRTQDGKRLMDEIRSIFAAIIEEERALRDTRLRETRRRAASGPYLTFGVLAIAALVSLLAIASVRRTLRRSEAEEQRAHAAAALLRATMENITQGVTVFDDKLRLVAWNDRFFEMFDLPGRFAVTGTPFADIVAFNAERGEFGPGDRIEQIRRRLERVGRWRDFQFERERPNGRIVEVNSRIAAGGLLVTTYTDITERRRTERIKEEFVSTVSHELRTPLTSISGSLGLLAGGAAGELPTRAARLIGIAHANSERLVRLINDILDIEKLSAGKVRFDMETKPLRPLVEDAIQANQGFAESFGVAFAFSTDGSEPSARIDADRFVQVVTNLLSNAAKFSPRDARVDVSLVSEGDRAVLAVADRGPGIPEAFRGRIFERFAQADSSDARQKGGTGLGLSIVRHIVGRLGGSIDFHCPAEGGTVFRVELPLVPVPLVPVPLVPVPLVSVPLAPAASPAEASVPANTSQAAVIAPAEKRAVLLCDSDPDVLATIRAALDLAGLQVETVRTGAEAEERVGSEDCAALVVDFASTGGEVVELVRRLGGLPGGPGLPVVAVRMRRGEDGRIGSIEALHVTDWLEKPLDLDRLVHSVRRSVGPPEGRRLTVLHVEDDGDLREVVRDVLAPTADTRPAGSLAEARAILGASRVDLVLLDVRLPDGSGLDLLPELRALPGGGPPTILFSAADVDPDIVPAVAGALTKSRATVEELAAMVRAAAERR